MADILKLDLPACGEIYWSQDPGEIDERALCYIPLEPFLNPLLRALDVTPLSDEPPTMIGIPAAPKHILVKYIKVLERQVGLLEFEVGAPVELGNGGTIFVAQQHLYSGPYHITYVGESQ